MTNPPHFVLVIRMSIFDGLRRAFNPETSPPEGTHLNVDVSPWTIRAPGNHITRQYNFKDLAAPGVDALFQIWVTGHLDASGEYYEFVHFLLAPTLVPQECFLVAFLGTTNDQVEAGFFTVKANLVNGGGNTFWVENQSEGESAHNKCLQVLDSGKPMRFLLLDQQQCIIKIPLENDLSFRSALAEMRGIATGTQSEFGNRSVNDNSIPAMLDEITNSIVELKQKSAISYGMILPSLLAVSTRLLVQHKGLEETLEALRGTMEVAERGSRVPSSAILGVTSPEQPLTHRDEAEGAFWALAHQLRAKGHRINDIALCFQARALQLAEEKVDKWYAMAILKQVHDQVKREAL